MVILDIMVLWAGCQRVNVYVFVLSYVPTITDMSSCTLSTQCWLQMDISVNFKQYPTFHKTIKYSNIHSKPLPPDFAVDFPSLFNCQRRSRFTEGRALFINKCQRAAFLRVQLSRVAPLSCSLFAITSMLDIDGILADMCNSISDKDRFRPD